MKKVLYYLKVLWGAGPASMLLNLMQYVVFGISGSLLLFFSGQLVNALAAENMEKAKVVMLVVLISLFSYVSVFWDKFSQSIREKHIFSVQQYMDKVICEKIIEIPYDIQDTKRFQDDFNEIKQTNSKLYLFVTYFVQLISVFIQMVSPILLIMKLSVWAMLGCFALSACFIYCIYKMQFVYWSEYLSNTTLRRKMNYFLNLFLDSSILGVFKAFRNEKFFLDKTQKVVDESTKKADKLVFGENRKYYVMQLLILSIPISVMLLALYKFQKGIILVGDVIMYIGVGKQIHAAIGSMGVTIQKLQTTALSLDKLYEFVWMTFDMPQRACDAETGDAQGIHIEDLTFTYPVNEKPSLESLALDIGIGEKVAIVGENGAGKTTLAKLLLGLYKDYDGCISIHGKDIRQFSQEELSDMIAPCFQDFLKPNFKLREAVGMSKTEDIGEDSKILNNLELVQFDINEKDILDRQLGTMFSEGIDLSVGNWQKVAMARTNFSGCNILIFDEPLAAVDVATEYQFLEYLNSIGKNDTVIVISHRMLGMNLFDRIILLEDGRITEKGTHKELMALRKKYAQLYEAQQLG